jgi:hypothetical protein
VVVILTSKITWGVFRLRSLFMVEDLSFKPNPSLKFIIYEYGNVSNCMFQYVFGVIFCLSFILYSYIFTAVFMMRLDFL